MFTPQENQVLNAICSGLEDEEIAGMLGWPLEYIEPFCLALYAKIGVENRAQAIYKGLQAYGYEGAELGGVDFNSWPSRLLKLLPPIAQGFWTHEEISEATGLKPSTVKTYLSESQQ